MADSRWDLRRRVLLACLTLFGACETPPEPPAPPLGISLSETVASVPAVAREAGSLRLQRVESCEVPAYLRRDAAGPEVVTDLPYGEDDHQRYDIAMPDDKPKLLVVVIHGGGWTSGYKGLYRALIRTFAELGYAAASVEYRLARDARRAHPTGLADVRCAIRAARLRAGTAKLVLLGGSAGAHLAAMATVPEDGDCLDKTPIQPDGAILFYAPLELDRARERYTPYMRQATDELLYGAKAFADKQVDESSDDWARRARAATPSHFASLAPPTLMLHGTADGVVPEQDALDYQKALDAAGTPSLVIEVPGAGHGFPVLGRTPELRPASCTVLHFLESIASR